MILARPRTIPRTTATPDTMPHSVLPTVLDHCAPVIRGRYDDFHDPLRMYTVPPCVYNRRRRASFKGVARSDPFDRTRHSAPLSSRYWHTPQSTPSLAETWEVPSLSRLACTPLLQAPPVQDNTVPSHTPLLDVWPRGRNQDKPVRYCVASCINHLGLGTRSIITSWCRTIGLGHRQYLLPPFVNTSFISHRSE